MTTTTQEPPPPSLTRAAIMLLRRTTLDANEALTPRKLAEMATWIEQEAPEAFRALKGVNTFIEGQVMAQQTPDERMISALLQETHRRHGPTLNALAAHGGATLREKPLPIYASRGRCAVDVQLNVWHHDSFCAWHDHDCAAMGMIVVEGSVLEERFAYGKLSRRLLRAGEMVLLDPATIHRRGGGNAVTLHAYGGGLRRMTSYRCGPSGAPMAVDNVPVIEAIWAR